MPIGNLISQHLANFYLSPFDHWIKEICKCKAYLRYMDDFILFDKSKNNLKAMLERIHDYLEQNFALSLKENTQLNKCKKGVPFLGFRLFPYIIRLSPRSRKRFIQKFKTYEKKWQTGEWSENELNSHMEPLIEFTRVADSLEFRRSVIKRFGVSS